MREFIEHNKGIGFDYSKYKQKYVCDFETSTEAWHESPARVWLWDAYDMTVGKHTEGTDIQSYFIFLSRLRRDTLCIFHNLAYDGVYIIDYALKNGWKASENSDPARGSFYCLITPVGQHYAYKFAFDGFSVVFCDSLKTIHQSVHDIALAYELPIEKSTIDYDIPRPVGHIPTDEEVYYISMDTEIIARALEKLWEEGLTKFTQPANAMTDYKNTLGKGKAGKDAFNALFHPEFSEPVTRDSYYGGFCWVNPLYKGKDVCRVTSYDINSMYPSAMLHYALPYGCGMYVKGNACANLADDEVAVQFLRVCFSLKEGHVPTVFKSRFNVTGELHMTNTHGETISLCLTSLDVELMLENYDIIFIEYDHGFVYKTKKGRFLTPAEVRGMTYDEIVEADGEGSMFYEYIKKWRKVKENTRGAKRAIAKQMLNMLYGNFGKHVDGVTAVPYINDDGSVTYRDAKTGEENLSYVELASFVTAQCRYHLIKDISANIDRFVYCDTDSMFLLDTDTDPDLPLDDRLFGYYKKEKVISHMRVVGAKRYIYEGIKDGKKGLFVACCGAPPEVRSQMTFDNFHAGSVFHGKHVAKTVIGGKEIVTTDYKLEDT